MRQDMSLSLSSIRGWLCVSIAAPSLEAAASLAAANEALADCFEIRLDAFAAPPDAAALLALSRLPLLITNRPAWEGGMRGQEEDDRLGLLMAAARAGAALVDIELRTPVERRQELAAVCRAAGSRLLVSWHDFAGTPSQEELGQVLAAMREAGADIGKIVTTAHCREHVLQVLDLYRQAGDFPLVAFCMGRMGAVSRVAAPALGAPLTYAAPVGGEATAPGQLDASRMRAVLEALAL